MIRPVTCLAFLLACGSGLYLYQVKHRVKVLDDQIAAVAKSTDALREQTRMLSAEWTLLNDPERLRKLANEFLTLQTVLPNQFTSLADLDSRLPPPMPRGALPASGVAAPAVAEQTPLPAAPGTAGAAGSVASEAGSVAGAAAAASPKVAAATSPAPARDTKPVAVAAARDTAATAKPASVAIAPNPDAASPRIAAATVAAHTDDRRMASHPPPRIAAVQPRTPDRHMPDWTERRPPNVHEVAQRTFIPRAVEPRPVMAARLPPPMPAGGSFLGMAHDMPAPPAPMPMPRPMAQPALIPYGSGD